jgi:hypothetical protein
MTKKKLPKIAFFKNIDLFFANDIFIHKFIKKFLQ